MTATTAFPETGHDHDHCRTAILTDAEHLCDARRVRLTATRRQVLAIVAERHGAIGAYEILDRLSDGGRRATPVTVYRALEFLIDQGLVHRLASLNAYVACPHASARHGAQFLICKECGTIGEMADAGVSRAISDAAEGQGFAVSAPVVEIKGLCPHCRQGTPGDVAD